MNAMPPTNSPIVAAFIARTPGSAENYETAQRLFPGGVTHDSRYVRPHPLAIVRAEGARQRADLIFHVSAAEFATDRARPGSNATRFAVVVTRLAGEAREAVEAKRFTSTLIVTLGKDGAIATVDGELLRVSAPEITPVDTVGAGDTFCGYLAAALDSGLELEEAMCRATVAGSLACLKSGAQPSIPHATEVDEAMAG